MHPEKWNTIQEIFRSALEHAPEDRAAFLDTACKNDPELRREIDSMIEEASQTSIFMDAPFTRYRQNLLDFAHAESLTGCELNHYRIGQLLGTGGAARVYRAWDTRLHRDVAIKVLQSEYLFDREWLDRLYREAQVLASLNHPNVASVYGFEEANGICALVLELVEGKTLAEHIGRLPVPVVAAVKIAAQIAAALEAAHAKGIIHRDLTPANIKLTPSGQVKVLDFGIAKLLKYGEQWDQATTISRENAVLGTVAYMSPEQARGKDVDIRTDIWAFGCLLYEMYTGIPAFHGETPTDIVVKIATEEPDWNRLARLPVAASVDLQRITQKCMQKTPANRYQSVRELAIDLDAIRNLTKARSPVTPPQPDTDFTLPRKAARPLFMLTQFGYIALYIAAMYHIEAIGRILSSDFLLSDLLISMNFR